MLKKENLEEFLTIASSFIFLYFFIRAFFYYFFSFPVFFKFKILFSWWGILFLFSSYIVYLLLSLKSKSDRKKFKQGLIISYYPLKKSTLFIISLFLTQQFFYLSAYLSLLPKSYQLKKAVIYDFGHDKFCIKQNLFIKNSKIDFSICQKFGEEKFIGDCYLVEFRENSLVFEVRLKEYFSKNTEFCKIL